MITAPARHTPGPWETRDDHPGLKPIKIFQKGARASNGCIAQVMLRDGREHLNRADARLIAAAPNLLCALKSVRDEVSGPQPYSADSGLPMHLVEIIIAAINLAEEDQ
jgi:hypothetical protein